MDGGCGGRGQELDVLPQDAGLIVADRYGGVILQGAIDLDADIEALPRP